MVGAKSAERGGAGGQNSQRCRDSGQTTPALGGVRPRLTLADLAGYEIDTGKVHACRALNMALRNEWQCILRAIRHHLMCEISQKNVFPLRNGHIEVPTYPRGVLSCYMGGVLIFALHSILHASEKLLLAGVQNRMKQESQNPARWTRNNPAGVGRDLNSPDSKYFKNLKFKFQTSVNFMFHSPTFTNHPQPVSSISGCLTDKDPNVVKIPAIQATLWSKVDERVCNLEIPGR